MDSPTKKKIVEEVVGSVLGRGSGQNGDSGESAFSLDELRQMENDATAVLGGSDFDNCSYKNGYVKRQALYACLSCLKDGEIAGMCLACSDQCHADCDLIELYTKRNFRCDCGTGKYHRACQLDQNKTEPNDKNTYDHNFQGKYCSCSRPYPDPDCPAELEDDEMIQCVSCEDWWHGTHLLLTKEQLDNEGNVEMICTKCLSAEETKFLRRYSNANKCTETVSADCKLAKEDLTEQVGGSFFSGSFRSDLCKCDECRRRMKDGKVEFLYDEGDTIEAYESSSLQESEQVENETNTQINSFMDRLDHRGQIEIAHGVSLLKSAMASMIESAGETGVVTEEHVAVFKRKIQDDLEERKRRRLEHGATE